MYTALNSVTNVHYIQCVTLRAFMREKKKKSFMRQVAIIEAHGVPWNFWIL